MSASSADVLASLRSSTGRIQAGSALCLLAPKRLPSDTAKYGAERHDSVQLDTALYSTAQNNVVQSIM